MKKTAKPAKSPDRLTKTKKPSGVALTEKDLGQVVGGINFTKIEIAG